jgi:light-regulated signal transduction histidine kinase (bacteriophytochrome)
MSHTNLQKLSSGLNEIGLLRCITTCIWQSLELSEILTATAAAVRTFLETERVTIYKFHPDGSGQVVAESIDDHQLPSLLGLNFPADDIPPYARELFIKARMRSIVNVESRQIGQSVVYEPETGTLLFDDIRYRPVDPCHANYLTAMGVKSSLVLPIIYHEQLWGLLVSHHSQSWAIPEEQLQGVQLVVDQLSMAIAHSTLLTQAHEKAQRETTINHIATLLHSLSTIELQSALEETVAAFQGSGGRLYINPEAFKLHPQTDKHQAATFLRKLYTCGVQPSTVDTPFQLMEQCSVWQEHFKSNAACAWAISDLYHIPGLAPLQPAFGSTKIRGILIAPLRYRQQTLGYLSIFRDEIDVKTLWAGQFDPDQRQIQARLSFEVWKESRKGQAREWTEHDIELVQTLSDQFATALQHYEMHQQVQVLNANLENQVIERTADLQMVLEQQQTLFDVVTKIRSSLNLSTIFQTATREICQLLSANRVAVYRFKPDWSGEFLSEFEFIHPDWSNSNSLNYLADWQDIYSQDAQKGRYHHNETVVVHDVEDAGLSDYHLNTLNQLQIKAFIVAPIFVGQRLWGLLAVYQHAESRHWDTSEVMFMNQIAAQLGVALQQSDFLTQTQQQAEQLAQALQNLQKAQTHLVQTEKMSSLGQLVAGVAHEINNPVNFICGNLTYVSNYATDLLSVLDLYQTHYPEPAAEICARAEAIDLEFLTTDLPKMLNSMQVGVDRIRQIVLSLRNFSRLDQADMKPVDIHEGIDSTLMILQHRLKGKLDNPAIRVLKDYGNLPLVECYAGQLNQVFMNVLSNAIDALEEQDEGRSSDAIQDNPSTIRIQTEMPRDGWVAIRMADNGVGIPESIRRQLFDPFFTTKPVGKGTGLGLSISYQIVVEKHGGDLRCASTPGQGTEFTIEIPIQQYWSDR